MRKKSLDWGIDENLGVVRQKKNDEINSMARRRAQTKKTKATKMTKKLLDCEIEKNLRVVDENDEINSKARKAGPDEKIARLEIETNLRLNANEMYQFLMTG